MKLTIVSSVMICVGAVGLTAARAQSDMYGMPVRMLTTRSGSAFTGSGSTGNQAGQSDASIVNNTSSSGNSSSTANTSSSANTSSTQKPFSNPSSSRGSTDRSDAVTRGQEKVIVTGEKGKEVQATGKTETATEGDKIFKPSLLDTAISDISKLRRPTDTERNASNEDPRFKTKSATSENKDDSQKKN
jgi:hypothetical protein